MINEQTKIRQKICLGQTQERLGPDRTKVRIESIVVPSGHAQPSSPRHGTSSYSPSKKKAARNAVSYLKTCVEYLSTHQKIMKREIQEVTTVSDKATYHQMLAENSKQIERLHFTTYLLKHITSNLPLPKYSASFWRRHVVRMTNNTQVTGKVDIEANKNKVCISDADVSLHFLKQIKGFIFPYQKNSNIPVDKVEDYAYQKGIDEYAYLERTAAWRTIVWCWQKYLKQYAMDEIGKKFISNAFTVYEHLVNQYEYESLKQKTRGD